MKMPKSKLGFLLVAVYIFIAGLFFIYAKFMCSTDALYCGMIAFMPAFPFILLTATFTSIFLLPASADLEMIVIFFIPVLVNVVLAYFIGSLIQKKFSSKVTRIVGIGAIIIAIMIAGILGIRYFNKSDIWKPDNIVNVNNPVNSGNYCQQDSDCVLAPQYQGCCPNVCEVEAINIETKNRKEEARNKQYNCHFKKISCPQAQCASSVAKQAVCEQNRCVVKEKQTVVAVTNYKIIGSFTSPGESSFVKALGATAFLTDISEGLLAIDVSNPEKPVLLDKIKIGNGGAYALAVNPSGLYAAVSGYGNSKVTLIDIRNPKNLRIMNEIDAKRSVQDMVTVVDKIYLAIDGPEVEVLTLKFTESIGSSIRWLEPTLISKGVFQIQGGGHAIGMAVGAIMGDPLRSNLELHLIIAQGESGVGVYKRAEFMMSQFSFVSNVGYASVVDAYGNYAYAGVGNAIKVIDLKTQKEIADIKVDDVWNFKVKDRTLYVASGEEGVKIIDISDIRNPKQIALIDTPGRARSIDVSADGKYIYVADDRDDLQIIKVE